MDLNEYPIVSIIIPTYNEEKYIANCINSLINNNYPEKNYEIIIIDGYSTDSTLEVVKYEIKKNKNSNIKLLKNDKKFQVFALNIGILNCASNTQYIMRADAHSVFPPNYISICVECIKKYNADNVGGVMSASGSSYLQKSIAFCMSHYLGVGNSKFHTGDYSGFVDTVYLGFFKKEVFDEVGLYDTNFKTNEDAELNLRIIKKGGKIYLDNRIKVIYYPRNSIGKLFIQYYRYGVGRAMTTLKHKQLTSLRQVAAPFFVIVLLLSILLGSLKSFIFYIPIIAYIAILTGVCLYKYFINKNKEVLLAPIVFFTMHTSWGLGFFKTFLNTVIFKFKKFFKL